MSEQLKHTELLNETSPLENSNTNNLASRTNTELVYEEQYKDTMFYIRGNNDMYFITIGNFIISKNCKTKDEAKSLLDNLDIMMLVTLIETMITFHIEQHNLDNELSKYQTTVDMTKD